MLLTHPQGDPTYFMQRFVIDKRTTTRCRNVKRQSRQWWEACGPAPLGTDCPKRSASIFPLAKGYLDTKIREKTPGLEVKKNHLHQDKAPGTALCFHGDGENVDLLHIPHPYTLPDLEPLYFHLFLNLKESFRAPASVKNLKWPIVNIFTAVEFSSSKVIDVVKTLNSSVKNHF
ncbi:hypothetical protein TNIN_146991 [Trichonephila inaurata madagascariensis]|uniref:Uncharacterized protein n=1 Tax=Trichonephila inaurata madagascariensis TaxID=2747483 RepID=A0A8X7CHX9_9ARAC|nr:hypothetical protein TNIN_146991 [Trichonephila inaurata madagascariensis]